MFKKQVKLLHSQIEKISIAKKVYVTYNDTILS